ncbi:hypothetical protein GIB67_007843 [Kingdonia uniflora]|uniref:Uncharacterized protein n=1 Tax=Kingdonia uniflora TaxID=39325 RepID=A0A7J7N2F1_9MAGN|nr:hypothetical protein GIB67_007843 [Kingdonia uniflora]
MEGRFAEVEEPDQEDDPEAGSTPPHDTVNGLDEVSVRTKLENRGEDDKESKDLHLRIEDLEIKLAKEKNSSAALLTIRAELKAELEAVQSSEENIFQYNYGFMLEFDRIKQVEVKDQKDSPVGLRGQLNMKKVKLVKAQADFSSVEGDVERLSLNKVLEADLVYVRVATRKANERARKSGDRLDILRIKEKELEEYLKEKNEMLKNFCSGGRMIIDVSCTWELGILAIVSFQSPSASRPWYFDVTLYHEVSLTCSIPSGVLAPHSSSVRGPGVIADGWRVQWELLPNLMADLEQPWNFGTHVVLWTWALREMHLLGQENDEDLTWLENDWIGAFVNDLYDFGLPKRLSDISKTPQGKLNPVIGRQEQIDRVVQILCKIRKDNPCLIRVPGVGKSAIAEGLAQCIVDKEVPSTQKDTKVNKYFEERLVKLVDEVKQSNGCIIPFIDEVHTLVGAGKPSGKQDACMAATTHKEYKMHIEKDPALERCFQPVNVPEPTVEETVQILEGLRAKYETHHKVHYEHVAFVLSANLSHRYISSHFLPDKAIDLIDEAGSWVRFNHKKDSWGEPIARESDIERIITLSTGILVEKISSKNVERLL